MADNINKVTIDAAWFAELYAKWIAKPTFSERMVADGAQAIRENKELRKERDELKEKLGQHLANCRNRNCWLNGDYKALEKERDELIAKVNELNDKLDGDATANGLSPATMKLIETENRLAAAERCIEDIETVVCRRSLEMQGSAALNVIRAYREAKGDNQRKSKT